MLAGNWWMHILGSAHVQFFTWSTLRPHAYSFIKKCDFANEEQLCESTNIIWCSFEGARVLLFPYLNLWFMSKSHWNSYLISLYNEVQGFDHMFKSTTCSQIMLTHYRSMLLQIFLILLFSHIYLLSLSHLHQNSNFHLLHIVLFLTSD